MYRATKLPHDRIAQENNRGGMNMNIVIANRLLELRKKSGYSQEELAEKLGISRQSVSKWERAEASPDTDNLILLAQLYNVSLDELLMGSEPDANVRAENQSKTTEKSEDSGAHGTTAQAHIGRDGIHVVDDENSVHVTWNGVHIEENGKETMHIDKNGVHIDCEDDNGKRHHCSRNNTVDVWHMVPVPLICVIAFLLLGFLMDAWGSAWIVFLAIPVYYSLMEAIRHRNAAKFAYPVFVTALYLIAGIIFGRWHPEWVMFLTIPIYYVVVSMIRRLEGIVDDDESDDDDCD